MCRIKPPIMGLFLVPYMESMKSSWEFTAGIYRRCLFSTSGNTFYQHGIVKFCRKNQRFFGGIGALLHTKKISCSGHREIPAESLTYFPMSGTRNFSVCNRAPMPRKNLYTIYQSVSINNLFQLFIHTNTSLYKVYI